MNALRSRGGRVLFGGLVGFLLVAVGASGTAQAQEATDPSPTEMQEARTLFEQGVRATDQERWGEALAYFQRSIAIVRRPSTVYNVGNVLLHLGRASEAIAAFDEFLRSANPEQDRVRVESARRLRDQARAMIATLVVLVNPETASVSLDGNRVEGRGPVRELQSDPGRHVVELSAAGFITNRLDVVLLPGARTRREVELEREVLTRGRLLVDARPANASVRVDTLAVGEAPGPFDLEAGVHRIEVLAPGHRPLRRNITLRAGQELRIEAPLETQAPSVAPGWIFLGIGAAGIAAGLTAGLLVASQSYGGTAGVSLPTSP